MNYRVSRFIAVPFCTLALLAGGSALVRAQEATQEVTPPAAAQPSADAQAKLDAALRRLDRISRQMDPESQKRLPSTRAIITRVCLHPEKATPTEFKIASVFIPHEGARSFGSDLDAAEEVKTQLQKATSTQIEFLAAQNAVPGGQKKGIVYLKNPAAPTPTELVEIPAATAGYSVDRRAKVVAKRLSSVHKQDPLWWSNLDVYRLKDQVVVVAKGSKTPYVITADKDFARLQGMTPEELAWNLVDRIRNTVDPPNKRAFKPDYALTPQEKLDKANVKRQLGDDAYSQDNKTRAEDLYLQAVKLSPGYAVPYLRLADLYAEQGQGEKARAILQKGLDASEMDASAKTEVQQKFTAVSQKFSANP